jgi:hypothetical protein
VQVPLIGLDGIPCKPLFHGKKIEEVLEKFFFHNRRLHKNDSREALTTAPFWQPQASAFVHIAVNTIKHALKVATT